MRRLLLSLLLPSAFAIGQTPPPPAEDPSALHRLGEPAKLKNRGPFPHGEFVLEDGETIALLGGENFVREQEAGTAESVFLQKHAAQHPRLRWMAVEGDTVYEQSREMNFGSWTGQLEWTGASMVVCQFGKMESFDGPTRLAEFTAAYHRLLDQILPITQRIILMPPPAFEIVSGPGLIGSLVPGMGTINEDMKLYAGAVRKIAADRKLFFIESSSLVHALGEDSIAVAPELLESIGEKNRLWSQCWRPANWAFAYGDRAWAEFGKPGGGAPFLKEEFAQLKPIIASLDQRIAALTTGSNPPPMPAAAPPRTESVPALTPDEELKTFTIADGYEVSLFADESLGVVKPSQISWDEQGRLFVACSPGYPHLAPGESPSDYVLVCEDTNHDGRADLAWKYAENLTMTQGMEPGEGGLYVCDFDKLVHYAKPQGRSPSKARKVLLSGFGIGDTHQLINSVCHGDDGTLWFSQGLHINSRIETPHGLAVLEKSGIWRFDTRTLKLDGFFNGAKSGHNCWGVAFDDFGQIFHKSGDRPEGYWSVPGLVKLNDPDEYHGIGGIFQTSPKTTALEFVGTKAMPDEIQGCAVIAGFMGGVVELHRLIDDGAGYRSEQLPKLLKSSSDAFRPVDVNVGPDGAIYVCDFYNPIIGHYQASYRDPKRDKHHGRIWRITAKNRPKVEQPNFAGMTALELLKQISSPERWTRQQAKRLLAEMHADIVVPAAVEFSKDGSLTDFTKRELLGVFLAQHKPQPDFLKSLLDSKDFRVRAYATRAIGSWAAYLKDRLAWLKERVNDENPRVRVEAILAASVLPDADSPLIALEALNHPKDKFIDYALAQSLRAMKQKWEPAFNAGTFAPASKTFLTSLKRSPAAAASPGQVLYETLCMNCHQSNAQGLPGFYPPLASSDWVNGSPERLAKILMHGLTGPITINGTPFAQATPVPMPPSGLTDEQIANVLTYVRGNFGNKADAVNAAQVKKIREETAARTEMWSEKEFPPAK